MAGRDEDTYREEFPERCNEGPRTPTEFSRHQTNEHDERGWKMHAAETIFPNYIKHHDG